MITANARSHHDAEPYGLGRALAQTPTLGDRIRLIAERIAGRIAFSTSLGLEDQAILHAIATTGAPVDIFTLDTGRHFPETLETIEASERRLGLRIRVAAPDPASLAELVARDGIQGFRRKIEARKECGLHNRPHAAAAPA